LWSSETGGKYQGKKYFPEGSGGGALLRGSCEVGTGRRSTILQKDSTEAHAVRQKRKKRRATFAPKGADVAGRGGRGGASRIRTGAWERTRRRKEAVSRKGVGHRESGPGTGGNKIENINDRGEEIRGMERGSGNEKKTAGRGTITLKKWSKRTPPRGNGLRRYPRRRYHQRTRA